MRTGGNPQTITYPLHFESSSQARYDGLPIRAPYHGLCRTLGLLRPLQEERGAVERLLGGRVVGGVLPVVLQKRAEELEEDEAAETQQKVYLELDVKVGSKLLSNP